MDAAGAVMLVVVLFLSPAGEVSTNTHTISFQTQAACEAMKGNVAKSFATASRENFGGPHLAWKAQEMGRPWAGFYVECGATGS